MTARTLAGPGGHASPVAGWQHGSVRRTTGAATVDAPDNTFADWLRTQLRARRMSQRQLAVRAGVDHSTVSRLLRGDRRPTLSTATKIARGLRELPAGADQPRSFGLVSIRSDHPTARVEYALRADDVLDEHHVRRLMDSYIETRLRILGRSALGSAIGDRSERDEDTPSGLSRSPGTRPRAAR